jgi:hypothetical protein
MSAHGKRILAVSLTTDQMRALRAAVRMAQEDSSLYREGSLLTLARALEAIEAAWKNARPDYGPMYRSARKPRAGGEPSGGG